LTRRLDDDFAFVYFSVLSLAQSRDTHNDVHGLLISDFAKNDVLVVKVAERNGGDEELRAVGVWASVGHGQQTWLGVLVVEVFICELLAVDGLAARAITTGEVTTLQHEVVDYTMEERSLVAIPLLASAESPEIFGGARSAAVEVKGDASPILRRTDIWLPFNIEIGDCCRHI